MVVLCSTSGISKTKAFFGDTVCSSLIPSNDHIYFCLLVILDIKESKLSLWKNSVKD